MLGNSSPQYTLKSYVEALVKSLLPSKEEDIAPARKQKLRADVLALINAAVKRLVEIKEDGAEEDIGTIVFVQKDIAITCFHVVHSKGHISQDSLRIDGASVQHVVSFPYYDLSVYKCTGCTSSWLDLGNMNMISVDGQMYLASYPGIVKHQANSSPVICSGTICLIKDITVLGQYQCFSGSSGGAIVSSTGKLLGLHLESVYHEKDTFLQPPEWSYDCEPNESVRTLSWPKGAAEPDSDSFWQAADFKSLSMYAGENVAVKGHLGRFQPVSSLRFKLPEEGLIPCNKPRRKRQRGS